jgi:ribose/xylose/arabinose/galactoside ABC-type transport system permease subunit
MDKSMKMKISTTVTWLGKNSAPVALAILFVFGSLAVPNFLSERNLTAILFQYSIIGFLALGQLLVIITGGIDLSQGSVVALTSVVTSVVMARYGILPAVFMGLFVATALGLISGILVSRTKMPPFIVTLGMLGIARGLAMMIANAKPVPIKSEAFAFIGKGTILGIPLSAVLLVIACIILQWFLTQRRLGRYVYAVGSSEDCTILSGVNVNRVKLFVYIFSAFMAAVGGLIWSARLSSGSPIGGSNYEMESIAAVVVGGGDLFGGQGSVLGTFSGVLIFGLINSMLNLAGISPFWQGALKGILILLAVSFSLVRRPGGARK